jgi:hypothetical protein
METRNKAGIATGFQAIVSIETANGFTAQSAKKNKAVFLLNILDITK